MKALKFILCLILSFVFTLFSSFETHGQTKKGEKLMEEGRYSEAIRPLKKSFEKDVQDRRAGLLLIESYYRLQEYQEALDVATLMDMSSPKSAEEARLFADVKIANNNFSDAYLDLISYLTEGGSDGTIYLWLDKAGNLLKWDTLGSFSKVSEISGINTIYNEYAPYLSENELWFVADPVTVQVLFPSAFNNQSLHVWYRAPSKPSKEMEFSRPKMLMKTRDYYYHDGPLDYWKEKEKYALTLREIDGLIYDLKTGIYFSDLSGKEDQLIPFEYNGKYNTGHPAFAKNSRMYFASDREGGYGQMDIWFSDYINGKWTTPVNAGPMINSPGNEVFPHYRKGRLFYASDRRDIGYGGLDLYYVSLLAENSEPYNLRAPVNGPYDDFAVYFGPDFKGFYSSNDKTGVGGDDIYSIEFIPEQERIDSLRLSIEETSAAPTSMRIFDSSGREVRAVEVDKYGMATVSDLYTREVYTLSAESLFEEDGVLVVYNAAGQPIRRFQKSGQEYEFELMDADKFGLEKQDNVDQSELFDLLGEVISEKEISYDSVSVVLRDQKGKSLSEVETDDQGRFSFKGLRMGLEYGLYTEGVDVDHGINILGNTGAPTQSLVPEASNSFAFTRTPPDAVWTMSGGVTVPVVFGIVPTKEFEAGQKAELYALNDSLIRKPEIDEDGFMNMGSLIAGNAYEVRFADKQFSFSDLLVILGGSGDTTQTVRPKGPNSFVFEYMIYGTPPEEDEKKLLAYKGFISNWRVGHSEKFILKEVGGTLVDTVEVSSEGRFRFEVSSDRPKYSLEPVNKELELSSSILNVFTMGDKKIAEVSLEESGVYIFGLLPDEEYALSKQGNQDDSSLGLVFEGSVSEMKEEAEFILLRAGGQPVDTIRIEQNQRFELRLPDYGKYELRTSDDASNLQGSTLNVYDTTGVEVLQSDFDGDAYKFELLKDENYALTKEKNEDESGLTLSFSGSSDVREKGKSVFLYNKNEELIAEGITLADGSFSFTEIPFDSIFNLRIEGAKSAEMRAVEMGLTLEGRGSDGDFIFDYREAEKRGRVVPLNDVYYAFNVYGLNEKSKNGLQKLIQYLRANPDMRIKILSHTDTRGPSSYNLTLSQKRAQKVVEYLVENGIDPDRLESEGRGEKDLVNRCSDGVRCSNAEHAKNRRTEFVVLNE